MRRLRTDVAHAPDGRIRLAHAALLASAAVLFVVLRQPVLSVPFERDEGEYAYIAWRVLEGDVPYRDAFDQKPPGVFVAYLAAFTLFGPSVEAVHGFMYVWTAFTALALYLVMRRLADPLAAGFAVLLFSIVSIDPSVLATAANTEIFMLLPMVASLASLLRALDSPRARAWRACGVRGGAACWFKPVAVANALFLAVAVVLDARARGRGIREVAPALAWLGLGAAAASAPVLLYFALMGAWQPFVDAVFLHNLAYSQRVPLAAGLRHAAFWMARQLPSLWLIWVLAAAGLALPRLAGRRAWAILAGFLLASAAGVSVGFYFRPHYFIQALPALAALASLPLAAVTRRVLERGAPLVAWAAFGVLGIAVAAAPVVGFRHTLWAGSGDAVSRRIYGLNPFVESERIARYIERTSDPDDTVYIVGSEPQILFHARRRSATRYIFFYPLTASFDDAAERQREVIRAVTERPPRYVVWADIPASLLEGAETDPYVFDESLRLLETRYALEFIARPPEDRSDPDTLEYDFEYGTRARELFQEAIAEQRAMPWVAVFRRRP